MLRKLLYYLVYLPFIYSSTFAQSEKPPCSGGSYDLVAPYLGTWQEFRVTDSTEVLMGTLTTRLLAKGCAISQHFMEQDSSFSYQSLGYVNPSSGLWQEHYVFSTGGTATYQWMTEGDMIYTLRVSASRSSDHIYRLRYTDTRDDEYTVVLQRSYDGGKTWESTGKTRIKRIS